MSKFTSTFWTPSAVRNTQAPASTEARDAMNPRARMVMIVTYLLVALGAIAFRDELTATIRNIDASEGASTLFGAAAVVSVIVALGLPAGATYLGCGALLGAVHGGTVSIAGAMLGSSVAFAAARRVTGGVLQPTTPQVETIGRIESALAERGASLLAWLRLSPFVPVALVNLSAAVLGVRWRTFLISLPASGVSALAFALVGALGSAAISGDVSAADAIPFALAVVSTLGMLFAARSVHRLLTTPSGAPIDGASKTRLSMGSTGDEVRASTWPGEVGSGEEPRTIGVELEFVSMDVPEAARIVATSLGGEVHPGESPAECTVETPIGRFVVERDSVQYKRAAARDAARAENDDEPIFDVVADAAVLALGQPFVPTEVVSPPLTLRQLPKLDALADALRSRGARGTDRSPVDALGLHLNPEAVDRSAEGILATMRAFFLLRAWLRKESKVTLARRASGYVAAHERAYVERVLDPDYAPDLTTLAEDYVREVGSRNRDLDLLPLVAHLCPEAVRSLGDERIKARPTYHYRLPNCAIADPAWSVRSEWSRWTVVEALADQRTMLAAWLRDTDDIDSAVARAEAWAAARCVDDERASS